MTGSKKSLSISTPTVDIDALERELLSALNHSSPQPYQDDATNLERSNDSDDVLMQLAIESELAINSPKVLQERKKHGLSESSIQPEMLTHLKELDSLLDHKSSLDTRRFSLNQKQEFDLLLNNQMGIDCVINSLSSDGNLALSDSLNVEDCIDPLTLFKIGDKPIFHANETIADRSMPEFTQQGQYQSSLDSVVSIPSVHDDSSDYGRQKNVDVMDHAFSTGEHDDIVEDILDLIPPTNGQK